jgi:hypothetical protein
MRVDGGTRPTNDWNFAGFNLTDIGSLGVSNRIFAGKAGDPNCDVSSNQHAGGAGDINACRDMVAKGWVKGLETVVAGPNNDIGVRLNRDGSIQGKTLNVDSSKNVSNINNITQSGGIKSQGVIETTEDFITAAGKKVQAGYFKFLNTVTEGAGCASDYTNSLTLDTTNNNKLLRCDGTTWVSMLQKGETGAPGTNGTQGIQGEQGPAGPAGPPGVTSGVFVEDIWVGSAPHPSRGFRTETTRNTSRQCDRYTATLKSSDADSADAYCSGNIIYLKITNSRYMSASATWSIFTK